MGRPRTIKEVSTGIDTLPTDDFEEPIFVYDKATKTDYPVEAVAYVSDLRAARIFINTDTSMKEPEAEQPANIEDSEHMGSE